MKREVLRINNFKFPYTRGRSLEWINLTLFEGECTGFLGLSYSGKDTLIHILTGEIPASIRDMQFTVDGEKVLSQDALEKMIYHLGPSNYRIGEWTVAEYIGLKRSGWLQIGSRKRELVTGSAQLFQALGIPLDVTKKLKQLTELELRLADLGKAYLQGTRILIIEDEFEGMTPEEISEFADYLRKVLGIGHFTVIISSHSNLVTRILAEHYIIFRDGKIIKKCRREAISNRNQLETYLLGEMITTKQGLDAYAQDHSSGDQDDNVILMRVRGIPLDGNRTFEYGFRRGSVTMILALSEIERRNLFLNLSGREMDEKAYCIIDDRRLGRGGYQQFVEKKIVSIMHLGSPEDIFDNMSMEENVLLPSLRKISARDYLFSSEQLIHAVDIPKDRPGEHQETSARMDFNDRLVVVLERWYLYNPKVLILLEPFVQCDIYGVSIVRSYIRRFAARGTAVIVIKCRDEDMENISDKTIRLY